MSRYFQVGEFTVADFSPVKIEPPEIPIDEMSKPALMSYLVQLRGMCSLEKSWQRSIGIKDDQRLIKLAEMYLEVQAYYAQFDDAFADRVNGPDYVPVLYLNGRQW